MIEKIKVEWDEVMKGVDTIVDNIKKDKIVFDGVFGVPRGGLCLAVMLSHRLGLPLLAWPTKNTLVVDDISDEGLTLRTFRNRKIACLYSTPWTETKPNYFALIKDNRESWIIFPWESSNE